MIQGYLYNCSLFIFAEFLSLQVPHSLALLEHRDLLCVADRENMRVACVGAKLRDTRPGPSAAFTIQQPDMGRVFGIASHGKNIFTQFFFVTYIL